MMTLMAKQLKNGGGTSAASDAPPEKTGEDVGRAEDEFTGATVAAATGVRNALTALVEAVGGGSGAAVSKPRELERELAVDYKLAWKVFLLLRETDGMKMAGLVPKGPSIRRLLEAAEKKGLEKGVLKAVRDAAAKFDLTVQQQAGDRVAFDAMVSGKSQEDGGEKIGLLERRTAYRVNSHIWGTQTDLFTVSSILKQSGEDAVDRAHVLMRRGFKRFRRGVSAPVYSATLTSVPERDDSTYEPVDRQAQEKYGVGLLPEFCSQPVPELRKRVFQKWIEYDLLDAGLGQTRAVDLAFGVVQRGAVIKRNEEGKRDVGAGISFRLPTEKVLMDFVVHRPSFGVVRPKVQFTMLTPDEQREKEVTEGDLLPIESTLHLVAGGLAGADTTEAPRHGEMVRHACGMLGWKLEEFDVYRLVVQYPVLHSTVQMGFWW